jgi:phosphocarrier protein HPr
MLMYFIIVLQLMQSPSLDLARVLTVQMNGENEEFEAYLETISPDACTTAA